MSSRELLRDALTVWRETRADAISEIIERFTVELSRGWEPPVPKLARTFHIAWLAAAADDVHRGWAAEHLFDKLPNQTTAMRERLQALISAGPDPRVGPHVKRVQGFDELVAQLIGGDELRPATDAELARFAPSSPAPDLASLERDIYANPDDNELRAVLADLLQTRGDPRGELIALQLAAPTDETDARIADLMRDHGRTWLGPLHAIARRAEFRRGFVSRLELASVHAWDDIIEHPSLATVEDLLPGDATGERYAELLASPAMTALRRIEVFDVAVVRALERTQARLVHVACPPIFANRATELFRELAIPALARIDSIESVACLLSEVSWVMNSPIRSRLRSISVTGELSVSLAFWRQLTKPLEVVISPHARLSPCRPVDLDGEGLIRAYYEDKQPVIRVEGPWAAAICGNDFERLLPVSRLEIVGATSARIPSHVEIVRIPQPRRPGVI